MSMSKCKKNKEKLFINCAIVISFFSNLNTTCIMWTRQNKFAMLQHVCAITISSEKN